MRYLKWMLVLFCLTGMTACRQDTPRFRIGVAQCSDDSWRHKMNDEILREAMFYNGVSVEIRSAGDDNTKQAEDVHYFMDEGVDLLIISANEAAPMTPIVEEAYQKGIPVILVDRKILSDKYTAYIGADNYEIGRSVGNYIASSLKGKGNIVDDRPAGAGGGAVGLLGGLLRSVCLPCGRRCRVERVWPGNFPLRPISGGAGGNADLSGNGCEETLGMFTLLTDVIYLFITSCYYGREEAEGCLHKRESRSLPKIVPPFIIISSKNGSRPALSCAARRSNPSGPAR